MGRLLDLADTAANMSSGSGGNPMYGWRVPSNELSGTGSKTLISSSSDSAKTLPYWLYQSSSSKSSTPDPFSFSSSSSNSDPPPFDSFGIGGRSRGYTSSSNLFSGSASSGKYNKTSTPRRRIASPSTVYMSPGRTRNGIAYGIPVRRNIQF